VTLHILKNLLFLLTVSVRKKTDDLKHMTECRDEIGSLLSIMTFSGFNDLECIPIGSGLSDE
jgi:hypothetical protein